MTVRSYVDLAFSRLNRALRTAHRYADRFLPAAPLDAVVSAPIDAASPGVWTVVREERPGAYRVVARCTTAALADIILADAPLDNTYAVVPPSWTIAP